LFDLRRSKTNRTASSDDNGRDSSSSSVDVTDGGCFVDDVADFDDFEDLIDAERACGGGGGGPAPFDFIAETCVDACGIENLFDCDGGGGGDLED
jgi:hypothetical protein